MRTLRYNLDRGLSIVPDANLMPACSRSISLFRINRTLIVARFTLAPMNKSPIRESQSLDAAFMWLT
jgi:hypothetical protein